MAYKIPKVKKFNKRTYHLESYNRTIEAEPIIKHSAQDWRKMGYKVIIVKRKGYVAEYINPKPKFA